MNRFALRVAAVAVMAAAMVVTAQAAEQTFAERLGWGPGDRVVIFHCDDAGMSHSSNMGAIEGIEKGVVTSVSTMMPCGWVPEFAAYLKEHPEVDNGLHLTLTAEWKKYRWAPLAGIGVVPGLVDEEGCMWHNVMQVATNASPDEFETEIRAQVARAEKMGIPITHLDTHMGTVYATPEFIARYIKVGVEKQIPIMIPGGHMTYVMRGRRQIAEQLKASGIIEQVWDAGLPVIDDLAGGVEGTGDDEVENLIEMLGNLNPGITQIIVHCTRPTDLFSEISSSGSKRERELETMIDPRVKQFIDKEETIMLTTWRELKQRRDAVGK